MTEVGLRAARALDAGAASGFTRSVPKESPRAEEAPETREYRGTGSSARMYASARLYAPPAMRQNVNATTVNALVAVTLAASAPAPEPYPVYAVDERKGIRRTPVRRCLRRRLIVPRGLLGAYDIATRMDEPEDPATDAEDELEGDDGAVLNPARSTLNAKRETIIFDLRSATATKDAVLRHARATCPGGLAALPLTREMYPGDAERDAAVLLARATHDGKAQTARLREREKKLGLGKRLAEKKRGRGGSGRGRGAARDGKRPRWTGKFGTGKLRLRARERVVGLRPGGESGRRLRRRLSVGGGIVLGGGCADGRGSVSVARVGRARARHA